jgi:hypothetical protein
MMHLLEERRKIFGLGGGHIVAQLEKSCFVEDALTLLLCAGSCRACSTAGVERADHGGQELQLLTDDAGSIHVVLEAFDGLGSS